MVRLKLWRQCKFIEPFSQLATLSTCVLGEKFRYSAELTLDYRGLLFFFCICDTLCTIVFVQGE